MASVCVTRSSHPSPDALRPLGFLGHRRHPFLFTLSICALLLSFKCDRVFLSVSIVSLVCCGQCRSAENSPSDGSFGEDRNGSSRSNCRVWILAHVTGPESKSSAKQSNNSKKYKQPKPQTPHSNAKRSPSSQRRNEERIESKNQPASLTLTKDVRGRCYVISEQDVQRDNERPQSPAVFSCFSLVAVFFLLGRRESRTAPSRFGRPFTCTSNPMREGDAEEAE
jgi:hypothetical protein